MSDIGKAMLLKCGWTEGRGLGKNEDGITQALNPVSNLEKTGLGHKEIFEDDCLEKYNKILNSIKVESKISTVSLSVSLTKSVSDNNCDIAFSNKINMQSQHKTFVKTSTLYNGLEQDSSLKSKEENDSVHIPSINEQLFKVFCEGKGVKCSLKNEKLKRVAMQKEMFLNKNVSNINSVSHANMSLPTEMFYRNTETKSNLKKDEDEIDIDTNIPKLNTTHTVISKSKKKKHKKRINSLAEKLSNFSIRENNETPKCTSLNCKKLRKKDKKSKSKRRDEKMSINSLKNKKKKHFYENISLPCISQNAYLAAITKNNIKKTQDCKTTQEEYSNVFNEAAQDINQLKSVNAERAKYQKRECSVIQIESDEEDMNHPLKRFKVTKYSRYSNNKHCVM